jgi:hypothetical protein
MRTAGAVAPLVVLFLVLTATGVTQLGMSNRITIFSLRGSPHFNYIVTIILENRGLNNTYGTRCSGNCTYITQLANSYSLAENYSDIGHPSLPNYIALTSGGNYDAAPFDRDCFPQSSGCSISAHNIVDSVDRSGRTWKAYMEDYTGGGCTNKGSSYYLDAHNPFTYFTDINGNATRCSRIVDANPGATGYLALPTQLLSDLNSMSTASNFMWLSPNACDDGHDACKPLNNTVSQQNQYLSLLVPQILNSTLFKTQKAALFITWDEAATLTTNLVTTIWSGPTTKLGYKSKLPYSHYSTIRTIEAEWNLPTLTTYDTAAIPMTEFFDPPILSQT